MKKWRVLIALVLAAVMLTGCLSNKTGLRKTVAFSDMEYTRPDMAGMQTALDEIRASLSGNEDIETLMDKVYGFYEWYYDFYTQYALADIHYCKDLTDIYWEDEYNFCLENSTQVDAALDQLLYDLADSGRTEELETEDYFGEDFFDSYEGESVWNEEFTALAQEEAELIGLYYELNGKITSYGESFYSGIGAKMAQLYVDLIKVRQEMALCAGYEDFASFAYDFHHYRDYTPEQAEQYMADVQKELVPLYRALDVERIWDISGRASSEKQTFAYVKNCAEKMGGQVLEAFRMLENGKLYDIAPGNNKYEASFEMYLYNYDEPFIFVNPNGSVQDQLTLVHEFGHFCNDYVSYGSATTVDVAEVFSQGMEYLSLCYGADTGDLAVLKMSDSLCVFVEQSAYASFEHQVYQLTGDDLTTENVIDLYERVGNAYGFDMWDWDSRDFVLVPHFFIEPMYVISYVVSNDAALQLYQLEKTEAGAGLQRFVDNLDTGESGFLAFTESAGLESPFAAGRVAAIRKTLESVLS